MHKKIHWRNEQGQSLVEFALVLPLLVILLVGILEFGWLYNGQITLTSAAREGARVAAVQDVQLTAANTYDSALNAQTEARITSALTNHVRGLSGLKIEEFHFTGVNAAGVSSWSDVWNQWAGASDVSPGEAGALVAYLIDSSEITEVRVLTAGRVQGLTGFFGFATDPLLLSAEAAMHKEK